MTRAERIRILKEMFDHKSSGYWKGKWYITEERQQALSDSIAEAEMIVANLQNKKGCLFNTQEGNFDPA